MSGLITLAARGLLFALAVGTCGLMFAEESTRLLPPAPVPIPNDNQNAILYEHSWQIEAAAPEYSLEQLEALAMANHPALTESLALIEAARGRSLQAGLPPNPTVGYVANEIGNEGSEGQHGAFVSRQHVRGGKLELSRAVECREVQRLRREYEVTRQRVLTDVRNSYYSIVWLQRRMQLLEQFLVTNRRAMDVARQLFEAGDNTKSDLLLAEIEYEQTSTDLASLSADNSARWRELARVVGDADLTQARLAQVERSVPDLAWEDALAMMQQSPRLAAALAEVQTNRAALHRARVEPIPNINTQLTVQFDFATDDTFAGVQVGMPIPTVNRNQGGIYAANANVRAAVQKYEKTRLLVERDLAQKFGLFQNARKQLDRIEKQIVPKTQAVVRIALSAYEAGEVGMSDVLNAQRSLLRAARRQQDAELQLRLAHVAIEGFVLSGGLGQ